MRVAFIGNMNNNNFSIMRYFRDSGIDAHLLLFKDDITKSQSHFKPEFDTWELDKWSDCIHYIGIRSYVALMLFPAFLLRRYFIDYDIFICSGNIPSILRKCNLKAHIYYPYGVGIEGVGDPFARSNWLEHSVSSRILNKWLRRKKILALKKVSLCLNSEMTLTKQTFDEIGIPFQRISIPMVYNKGSVPCAISSLDEFQNKVQAYKFKFFSHVSHVNLKNKRPMISGFAKFLERNGIYEAVLILLEYGTLESINETKKMINDYGISDHVLWLEKKSRKELLQVINDMDMGFSEFEGMMWGGTGWEFLSMGVPFFHFIDSTEEEFKIEQNVPMPPIINTASAENICEHLTRFSHDPELYREKGRQMKGWFEEYGGKGLAEKWIGLVQQIYISEKCNE